MNILAMDSSSKAVSVAYLRDGKILGQFYLNAGLSHSTTLMPMTENLLKTASLSLKNVDCFAVSIGPGSFTGLRIGISAIKGLSFAENKPCVGVSSLEAIAYNFYGSDTLVCSVIDARCQRFFCSFFRCHKDGSVDRLTNDQTLSTDEIITFIRQNYSAETITLSGDGSELAYSLLNHHLPNLEVAPKHLRYPQSNSVALIGEKLAKSGKTVTAQQLLPLYFALPQAQRELQKKMENNP
ncbi:MAG: tRNA (adenosine(37)-N6)-threonylcarbamoyltransferase complex dimerization subunit type 1 TsaB [Clostridia bacterium]|nr:tRNA (adenosine(37)-N6)-threonylcarbamoyltransferase complex dimerization subunit type 1 TsaB [Clostridia bacterium]